MTKQSIELLLFNGTVVTMDAENTIYKSGAVAIDQDQIVAVGESEQLLEAYQATKMIDCQQCVISPGLINAHTHTPMTLLRGLSDDLRLDVWLYGFMMPVEREFVTPEFSYSGALLACAEMIRGGVTTFCDMYYYEDHVAQAAAKAGMRAVCAQTILKFPAPDAASYDESLEYCRVFIEKWKGHPLIVPAVGPHAPYTATPDMLRACVAMAKEYDVPIHTHIAETSLEQENSRSDYDMTVVPWLEQYGLFEAKVIAAHCVCLEEAEMHTLKAANAGAAHCPTSNLKLASGVAPIHQMLDMGINVGIGTDGTASNNDLDMIEETRLAAILQKGAFADPTLLPAQQAWHTATMGGAKALHLDHITGSLEVGKRADVIVIDLSATHQTPRFSHSEDTVFSQLVYAAKSSDLRDVIVNGQLLMENQELLTIDEPKLQQQAVTIAEKIDTFLSTRESDLMLKLLAISTSVVPIETYEVQVKVEINEVDQIVAALDQPTLAVTRSSTRNQYDVYFCFEDQDLGRIRYREDEVLGQDNKTNEIFYRITLIGPTVERLYDNTILLTRSRYSVSADKSRRFYREYFNPDQEIEVEKFRKRYHITYQDTQFVFNLDTLHTESGGTYLEIKSRTWSAKDADHKAKLIRDLLGVLGVEDQGQVFKEYLHLV
ncbi:MAG: amidohydrolase family protein [Chloroflexota bacterium]